MTHLQGWLLVIVATFGVGYFVVQTESAKPRASSVMTEHYRQMCEVLGQRCDEYREALR